MSNSAKLIVICQGKSCCKDGAKKVFKAFEEQKNKKTEIRTKYCFGKCGNGPMVVVLPGEIWYDHVKPEQASLIIDDYANIQA